MHQGQRFQLSPGALRAQIQRLRAWRQAWAAAVHTGQRTTRTLGAVVRAVPGQQAEASLMAQWARLEKVAEHGKTLARALEHALDYLEAAFHAAARIVAEGVIVHRPTDLPLTSLAVDGSGQNLPDQFGIRFRADGKDLRWTAACGPVALSMALSRLADRPIPAQEVADQLVRKARLKPPQEKQATTYTGYTSARHLMQTAQEAYGVKAQQVDLEGSSPEAAWEALRRQVSRPQTAVIALVTVKRRTTIWNDSWKGVDGRPAADIVLTPGKQARDGGILVGRAMPQDDGETSHWVVVDRLEEHQGQRYVVINNPFHNRRERYPWELFWNSVNQWARSGSRWWVVSLEGKPTLPEPAHKEEAQ